LHRDVKPANILLRRSGGQWEVKLIDFGLALRQELLGAGSSLRQGKTIASSSIAGTLDYAAPEQIGKLPGGRIGPPADVYGFAKTLCFALFEATDPTPLDWKKVPVPLAELIGHCLARRPDDRPASFGEVLRKLESLARKKGRSAEPVLAEAIPELVPEVVPVRPPAARFAAVAAQLSAGHGFPAQPVGARPTFPTTTAKRLADALLALLFGIFGVHKFSQGNTGAGWTRFFITCTCIGIYVTALTGVMESILYLTKSNEEYDHLYLVQKKAWF
jgi:TM2 domain-containing membrane protein YozV